MHTWALGERGCFKSLGPATGFHSANGIAINISLAPWS